MISGMKLKINTSLTMYNLENELIIYLVSYIWKLHQEITNLKHLRVYSYLFLSSNQKKKKTILIRLPFKSWNFFQESHLVIRIGAEDFLKLEIDSPPSNVCWKIDSPPSNIFDQPLSPKKINNHYFHYPYWLNIPSLRSLHLLFFLPCYTTSSI